MSTDRHSGAVESAVSLAPPTARRLQSLPPYIFTWLDGLKAAARQRGADLIDLGIGSPDLPVPAAVTTAMMEAATSPAARGYPADFRGAPALREAAAAYMRRRFGVVVDPEREILVTSGAKEAAAQLAMAWAEEGSSCLVPDIHYPVQARGPLFMGSRLEYLPLRAENGFLPRFDAIPAASLTAARMLFLNYPHNPTGAVAPLELYAAAVELCRAHGMVLVSDLAYAELAFDPPPPPSALQVPGARDVTVELHSFSKTFSMAGWRVAFAVGGAELIDRLFAVRMNMGYGTPVPVQLGAAAALEQAESFVAPALQEYRARRDHAVAGFRELGWSVTPPAATMFLWLPVPPGYSSEEWTARLIDEAGVVVTPGSAFGSGGEGYFRVSLVVDTAVLDRAFERLRACGIHA